MTHSKSIGFCTDCGRPISARATRCSRCAGLASRGASKRASTTSGASSSTGDARREQWRRLSEADHTAIRAAGPEVSHVDLAWRYGVSAAEIARIRDTGSGSGTLARPSEHDRYTA